MNIQILLTIINQFFEIIITYLLEFICNFILSSIKKAHSY